MSTFIDAVADHVGGKNLEVVRYCVPSGGERTRIQLSIGGAAISLDRLGAERLVRAIEQAFPKESASIDDRMEALESRVAQFMETATPAVLDSACCDIAQAVKTGSKLPAVRAVRNLAGISLRHANNVINRHWEVDDETEDYTDICPKCKGSGRC